MNKKKPWVLLPAGPVAWQSHGIILPPLIEAWKKAGAEIKPIWFPNPKISTSFISSLRKNASCLVFPPGSIHYNSLALLQVLRKKHKLTQPAIIMIISDLTKGYKSLFDFRTSLSTNDVFITNCSADRELLGRVLGTSIQCHHIPYAVKPFSKKHSSLELFKSLGLKSTDQKILYAGRVSYQKNIHGLISAFKGVSKKKSRAHLLIAGAADDIGTPHFKLPPRPRYIHELSNLVVKQQLENRVHFLPHLDQNQLLSLMKDCDAQASLTLHSGEDFGYSIAQGMSCGLPTVVSAWGGGIDFSNGGAIGVPVNITPKGPNVSLKKSQAALIQALKKPKHSLHYFKSHLAVNKVSQQWKKVFAEIESVKYSENRPLQIAPRFLKVYLEWRIAGSFYKSPRDKIYQEMIRVYAGKK